MSRKTPPDTRLLKPEDVAAMVAIPAHTLAQLRYRGEGPPYIKLGHRTVRYRPEAVEEWLDAQTVKTRPVAETIEPSRAILWVA